MGRSTAAVEVLAGSSGLGQTHGKHFFMAEPASESRPYIIYRNPPGAGFCSNFASVLQGLDHADQLGLVPVVDMERYKTHYNEEEPVNGTTNAWEYYFAQPGDLSLADALGRLPESNHGEISGAFTSVHSIVPPSDLTSRARSLIDRYIRVNPDILESIDRVIPPGVHQNILGVHVRGTDLRQAIYAAHAIPDVVMAYVECARFLDNKHRFSSIYLACDEQETVELFRKEFGSRLLISNVHRTATASSTSTSYEWLFSTNRTHHRYLLGREVLQDVLLLSRCGHLVCGMSNVAQSAMYFSTPQQAVHPIEPLWITPDLDGRSLGLDRIHLNGVPQALDPLAVVTEQKKELCSLLARCENALGETQRQLKAANVEVERLHKKLESAKKPSPRTEARISLLENRVKTLISPWAKLGWRLMPWTRPKWSKRPLKEE